MSNILNTYKERFHFSVNFYSLFLLFTFIPDILHVNNLTFKYAFWGIKIVLACWVISQLKKTHYNFFTAFEKVIILLIFIYAANIYIDVFINPLPALAKTDGVMDFIGFCLNLIIAISFRYDPAFHSEKSFRFFWITLTIGLAIAYFRAIANYTLDVGNIRYDANSTVNSINYGQMGCALALISILGITTYQKVVQKLFFLITLFIGIISIAKAGSRSPLVVLALVSIFFFLARFGIIKTLIFLSIFSVLFILSIHSIEAFLNSIGSSLTARVVSAISDNDSSGRDEIWSNTLNIIKTAPLTGKYYIIPYGEGVGGYPHNFFLEAFMATGLLGGIPFVALIFIGMYRSFVLLKIQHPSSWIVLLFLQMIVFGSFSTGLYSSQDLWALLFFVCSFDMYSLKASTMPSTSQNSNTLQALA